ncbi:MAG TPA: 50S ribosomal protein L24, partial [Planctomycetes bacterium]|nr:50S ribosomal protein L24 [Planctomycetota bacterium]
VVQGVNLRYKHIRKSQQNPQGGRVRKELPIHVSNVMLWSEKLKKGVRVKIVEKNGRKIRVGIPCGTEFDK